MALYEGERIKIFPETDVRQYGIWIHSEGFNYIRKGDYLVILNRNVPRYDKERFSVILPHRRRLKGMSKERLAELVEVTENTVSTWENGMYMPSKYNLDKIMSVLDITERDLERCRI